MKRKHFGYTVAELAIVIGVIGILATVTLVYFRGGQDRSEYTRAQSDLKHINDALLVYRSQNTAYPISTTLTDASSALSTLVPNHIDAMPAAKSGFGYKYISNAGGTEYKLIRTRSTAPTTCGTLPATETGGNNLLTTAGTCSGNSWGYWSSGGSAL